MSMGLSIVWDVSVDNAMIVTVWQHILTRCLAVYHVKTMVIRIGSNTLQFALLPLTVFYILAVLLSFNVTSSNLNGVILVVQCITSPAQMSVITSNYYANRFGTLIKIATSFTCTTYLDFFRLVYPPFCLHPKANSLQLSSLEYIVAAYPFFLIFITYVLLTAYDRQYRLLLYIWKPFKMCFHSYRKTWNIKTSLIEVFSTFILLSSVKILATSFYVLSFSVVYNVEGKTIGKYYSAYDGRIEYLSAKHLPYAVLATTVSFIFVLLPLLLLVFYPCGCFQRCLNRCGGRCRPLHVFMDAFQGCYRTHPRDLKYFSAFYFLLRVLLLAQTWLFQTSLSFYTSGILSLVWAGVIAIFQPYKVKVHNTMDAALLLLMGVYFISYHNMILHKSLNYSLQWLMSAVCAGIAVILPVSYCIFLLFWKFLVHFKLLALINVVYHLCIAGTPLDAAEIHNYKQTNNK